MSTKTPEEIIKIKPGKDLSKIWLSSPHMGGNEQKYVTKAFESNWIAPLGPHVNAFEEDLASFNGVKHAAALSSGTAALHLGLILLDVGPGDIVLCQSLTFSATANPIIYQGATPVFIDSEMETWNMDPEALEEAIISIQKNPIQTNSGLSSSIKAIVPVHLYGMPAKMNEIKAISDKYGIPVLEDAAEALGSVYLGKACGSLGDLGILSFNGNKIITTSGGGALISDDKEKIEKARFYATQSRDPAPHYQHSHLGFNYRMSNVLAGIGRGQMEVLPERVNQRRDNFNRYQQYFAKWQGSTGHSNFHIGFQNEPEGSFSNRWLTCITIDPETNNGLSREAVRLALEAENIEARPLWKPMHLQPYFRNYPYFGGSTSENLFDIGLCLPSGSNLNPLDFKRIFESLDGIISDFAST
jgi:dTDP-4-amino-4,6-dideoxygalactose transaminase